MLLAACVAGPAAAQLGLPGGGGGAIPGLGGLGAIGGGLGGQVGDQIRRGQPLRTVESLRAAAPLGELRRQTIDDLLRRHRGEIEADPAGEPVVRAEVLLLSPSDLQLAAARADGFLPLREQLLQGLDLRHVVLRPPRGMSTAEALQRLRALDPQIEADFNHIYTRSGSIGSLVAAAPALPKPSGRPVRVGLIDGGIDAEHPALQGLDRHTWGCDGKLVPSGHGTAVASLLVGRDGPFLGSATDASLFAADIYCGQGSGGSAEAVAGALAWMSGQRVAVVNLSLVGPANKLLERAVRAVIERGHLIVAAVGNDGPTAPALYPAAYPEVVGVTGIDRHRVVLPEAAQGPQVMLAAPGSEVAVARSSSKDYATARGTSFSAPLAAGLLASLLPEPDRNAARAALAALARQAIDLGAPGRDPVYGFGLVGEQFRVDPRRLQLLLGRSP